jgi:hypothetical protein
MGVEVDKPDMEGELKSLVFGASAVEVVEILNSYPTLIDQQVPYLLCVPLILKLLTNEVTLSARKSK